VWLLLNSASVAFARAMAFDAFFGDELLQTAATLMMQNHTETEKHKLPA